jgi:hypothetical protein
MASLRRFANLSISSDACLIGCKRRGLDRRERHACADDVVSAGWAVWAAMISGREQIISAWNIAGWMEGCIEDLQACCMGKRRREQER